MARSRLTVWLQYVLVCLTAGPTPIVSGLLPYGSAAGDSPLTGFSPSSSSISLSTPFIFFQDSHNSLFVNGDGSISFLTALTVYNVNVKMEALDKPIVCVFCAAFSPNAANPVWYRMSTDTSVLQTVQSITRQYDEFGSSYVPTWALIVTWDGVGSMMNAAGNTIQAVMASDGSKSLVLLEYEVISWIEGFLGSSTVTTKVGFTKGDMAAYYVFPESQTTNLTNLVNESNTGTAGQFLFRVDGSTISPVPSQSNTGNATTTITLTTDPVTTAPSTADSTTLAATTDSVTSLPTTHSSTAAPTTEVTTSAPSIASSSPVPTTEVTTSAPSTDSSSPVPTTEVTTSAPSTDSSAPLTTTDSATSSQTTDSTSTTLTSTTPAIAAAGQFDATVYYAAFGVSGAVLVAIGIACVVLGKKLARASTTVDPFPHPHLQNSDKATNGIPPAVNQLEKPFRIPRPSSK